MRRTDVRELLLGKGGYFDDVNYQGYHGVMVRSPYAHARIVKIDASEAERRKAMVLTGSMMKFKGIGAGDREGIGIMTPPLATTKVTYVGEPVAFVVAEDSYVAADLAELVQVDYDPLEPVMDIDSSLEGKTKIFEDLDNNAIASSEVKYGTLPSSSTFVDLDLYWSRSLGNPIEPFGVTAVPEADGLTIISNAQGSKMLASEASSALGRSVKIIPTRQGGSFGAKFSLLKYIVIVGSASSLFGVPVKWVETRMEHLMACNASGPERKFKIRAYHGRTGRVTGIDFRVWEDLGAAREGSQALKPLYMLAGPYKIRNLRYSVSMLATNKNPAGAFRGAGSHPHTWALERVMDAVADKLGLGRGDVRMVNTIGRFPYRSPYSYYDSGNPKGLLRAAMSRVDLFSMRSKNIGVGLALSTDVSVFGFAKVREEGLRLSVRKGKVVVGIGFGPEGQGHEHTAMVLVSRLLGIDVRGVSYEILDSKSSPTAFGPGGSKMAVYMAGSVAGAVERLLRELTKSARKQLGTKSVEYRAGYFYGAGGRLKITDLEGEVEYVYSLKGKDNLFTYPFACDIAVVKVDDLGRVIPLKQVVYIDPGTPLDEQVVKEQVQGGTAMGVSLAQYEKCVYGADGNLLTSTLSDYGMPTAADLPEIEVNIISTPSTITPMGTKGVGEIPVGAAAAAFMSAVEDATGKRFTRIPIDIGGQDG